MPMDSMTFFMVYSHDSIGLTDSDETDTIYVLLDGGCKVKGVFP